MRKRLFTKVLTAALALSMAASTLVGCGAKNEPGKEKAVVGDEVKKDEPAADGETEKEKPFDGVTLTWATTDNAALGSEMKELVALIKEKTGINIEFSIVPTPNAGEIDKVLVGLMAGDEIDIITRTPVQLKDFYNAGVLEPLDELAATAGYDLAATYKDNIIKFGEESYALPAYADIWLTYYNKKIFDDAGVEYPTADGWTWEKYVETAKKLQNNENNIWGSFMLDYDNYNYMYALQSGAECYKEDGTSNFDDEIFAKSIKFFYDFGNELKVQPTSVEYASGTYPYNSFMVNGNIGMFVCGGWVASTLGDQEKYPRDWQAGILPMPYPEGSGASSLSISTGVALPKTSKNKDAAFEAIKCIAENQYTLGHGRIPVRRDLTEEEIDSYITEKLLPNFAFDGITVEEVKAAWFDNDRKLVFEKVWGTADTTINQIWIEEGQLYGQGAKSLEDTMKSIKSRADEAIAEASAE